MTGIIVQARQGSKRLQKKSLMKFHGEPLLARVARLLRPVGEKIIVATSTNKEDDSIEHWCTKHKVSCFRGDADDVLRRFYNCASVYKLDVIIRITADCPFISSDLIELCLHQFLRDGGKGYVGFHGLRGLNVEVFDFGTLQQAFLHGPDEHVTTWMRKQEWAKSLEELEINTKDDFKRLSRL